MKKTIAFIFSIFTGAILFSQPSLELQLNKITDVKFGTEVNKFFISPNYDPEEDCEGGQPYTLGPLISCDGKLYFFKENLGSYDGTFVLTISKNGELTTTFTEGDYVYYSEGNVVYKATNGLWNYRIIPYNGHIYRNEGYGIKYHFKDIKNGYLLLDYTNDTEMALIFENNSYKELHGEELKNYLEENPEITMHDGPDVIDLYPFETYTRLYSNIEDHPQFEYSFGEVMDGFYINFIDIVPIQYFFIKDKKGNTVLKLDFEFESKGFEPSGSE